MNKFDIVKKAIDEWDPINLLSHAPEDEYDSEISDITRLIPTVKSVDELAQIIHRIFVKWFGADATDAKEYSVDRCYPVAQKIWRKLF